MFRLLRPFLPLAWAGVILTAAADEAARDIEARPGGLPVLLTVPHGGHLKPASILARRYGVTTQDAHTAELGELLAAELQRQYGGAPHLVLCRLHRSKVDCNRPLAEAAQGDPRAVAAWRRFHAEVETRKRTLLAQHGTGLLLDLHGHRHALPRVELGYLLPAATLDADDAELDRAPGLAARTSLRDLDRRSPQPLSALLRGPQSLGGLLESRGFAAVPSPDRPGPGKAAYFNGGYTTQRHGSRQGGGLSAIQVECPWEGVRDEPEHRRRFARALAEALGPYFQAHFGRPLAGAAAAVPAE